MNPINKKEMKIFILFVIGIKTSMLASVPVPNFNDPKFPEQFYLSERFGVTMNINKAWNKGFTGKGVTICIHDPSGVEKDHDELAGKFVLQGSYDYKTNSSDPTPDPGGVVDGQNSHGTQMAGLAAAKANNGKCGVGVAYDAFLSGIKTILTNSFNPGNKSVYDPVRKAYTLKYARDINDIYSCSWGPTNLFSTNIGYLSDPMKETLKSSAEKGRNGKGNIYVFGNGNNGPFNGSCGYNEYVTSIYTNSISVVTGHNNRSHQDERCAAISAVTYSRDGMMGIDYPHDSMPCSGIRNSCVKSGASSAATAVAAGVFALVLQANPNLGWRDLQHLIARSSCSGFTSVPWKTNKAGIRVSDDFGFGLLDADALTTNAMNWTNVGQHQECVVVNNTPEPIHGVDTIRKTVDFSTWPASCGGEAKRINFLEHVVLLISFNFTLRRNIEVEVTSPGGTKSIILRAGRRFDDFQEVKNLSTMSLHFWGEDPRGNWGITLRNVKPDLKQRGILFNWSLKLYGTTADPLAGNTIVGSKIIVKNPKNTASPPTTTNTIAKTHTRSDTTAVWTNLTNGNITQPTSSSLNFTEPCGKKNSQHCGTFAIGASSTLAVILMSIATVIGRID